MKAAHKLFYFLTGFATLSVICMLLFVLCTLIYHGIFHISINFLIEPPTDGMKGGGIFPAIVGTFLLVMVMTVVVMPFGVLTAIYLQEYASQTSSFVRLVRLSLQNLVAIPAIVYGLFGLGFFVYFIGTSIDQFFYGELYWGKPAILWSALTLALLTLPVVVVTTEEAMRRIPYSYREAAYAMGMTKWQVIYYAVLPQAMSGILTGGILALSRGAGEVAPVMLTGAAYYLPELPTSLSDQFMELGYHIYVMSTQSPDVSTTLPITYATALILLLITFSLNILSVILRARLRSNMRISK